LTLLRHTCDAWRALSNYYEILGVWRDASSGEIELAAQALSRRCQDALEEGDPEAAERLRVVEEARAVLLNAETRQLYDRQLLSAPGPVRSVGESPALPRTPEMSPARVAGSSSWQPYLCVLLSVPVVLSALVVVIVSLLRFQNLTSSAAFGDTIALALIPSSLVAFPLGFAVLVAGSRRIDAVRRLRVLEKRGTAVDPVALARLREQAKNYELNNAAVWATRISLGVIVVLWIWFATIYRARGAY
jgi:hypothetical protein